MATKAERLSALRDSNSFYFKSAESFLLKVMADAEKGAFDVGGEVLPLEERTIPYAVKGEDLTRLSKEFGWKLKIKARDFSRVPFLASKIHCAVMLNEAIRSWPGEEVVHLEGDVTSLVARRQNWKHICRGEPNTRAALAYAAQEEALRKMVSGRNALTSLNASAILNYDGFYGRMAMCTNARSCRRSCDTVVFNLAEADIPARQAAATVLQHDAARAKVWFFFETAMLYSTEGPLTGFPGRFFVDREADRLYLVPEGPSRVDTIEYRWSNVLSYISRPVIEVDGGKFLVEIHDSVPGVYFVMVSDARGECEFSTDTEHRLYHPAGDKMLEVTQRMVLPRSVSPGGGHHTVTVAVEQEMWERVVARLMAVKETRLTLQEARIAVADYSQQRVDVGAVIRAPKVMPYGVGEIMARAAWKKVVVERLRMGIESTMAREGVDVQWSGTLKRMVACGVRMMHETQATIGEYLLSAGTAMGLFQAEFSDCEVVVTQCEAAEHAGRLEDVSGSDVFSPAYPGGPAYDAASVTDGSVMRQELRERAMEIFDQVQCFNVSDTSSDETEETFYSCFSEQPAMWRDLPDDKELLVEKMEHVYDAGAVRSVQRVKEELVVVEPPECSVEVCTEDPLGVLQSDYVESMPALSGFDPTVTPYLLGEADKAFDIETARLVANGAKDELPREMRVRKSRLKTACAGKRPTTQSEAMLAFTKRVANAPVLAADAVYADRMASDFARFADVMLRRGWETRMQEAVAAGLWQLDMVEMRKHVAKLKTSSVGVMLTEDFRIGNIDMSSWVAMVKTTVKAKVSESASSSYAAPQTIVYQASKMTNSLFSPILSKVLDFVDQECEPYVRLNARRDKQDDERWANSMAFRSQPGDQDVEVDISQCDKSQCLYNMMLFFYTLEQFGAPQELCSVWKVMMGLKRANAMDVGMAIWYMYQVVSGFFGTIAANTIITAIANVVCLDLRRGDLVQAEHRGDDGKIRRRGKTDPALAAELFASKFNMEAKIFVNAPPYFCSDYEVNVQGYLYRIRDPEKLRETLGRYVSTSVSLEELHESFADAGRHYEKKEVLDALAVAVRERTGVEVRSTLRALSTLVQRRELFVEMFEQEPTVVGW